MTYDNEGRLASWTAPSGTNATETYLYDNQGNRVLTTSSVNGTATDTIYFDGITKTVIAGGTSTTTQFYSVGGQTIAVKVGSTLSYLVPDLLGSMVLALNASGTVSAVALYNPYGQKGYAWGTMPTDQSYTGQPLDSQSGLIYYNARWYDPLIGRFTSADTAQNNTSGMDPYAYVQNNPETLVDPTGHWDWLSFLGFMIVSVIFFFVGLIAPEADALIGAELIESGVEDFTVGAVDLAASEAASAELDAEAASAEQIAQQAEVEAQQAEQAAIEAQNLVDIDESKVAGDWDSYEWALNNDPEAAPGLWQQLQEDQAAEDIAQEEANIASENAARAEGNAQAAEQNAANAENAAANASPPGQGTAEGGGEGWQGGNNEASSSGSGCGDGLSFRPDTPVATAQGEQAIGTLQVGELVRSYNPQTQQMELEPIQKIWLNHDTDLVDLTLITTVKQTDGTIKEQKEVIHTNEKHPFFTREKGFLPVNQLKPGMHVLEADGTYGVVGPLVIVPGAMWMYNLTVAQDHTYTVGAEQWVVHNCGFRDGETSTVSEVLDHADAFLKEGGGHYTEVEPGRFVSIDGTRQFRMTDADIFGRHSPWVPHVNFETLAPTGRLRGGIPLMGIIRNIHVLLSDW